MSESRPLYEAELYLRWQRYPKQRIWQAEGAWCFNYLASSGYLSLRVELAEERSGGTP